MKLSEAIRIGAALRPQAHRDYCDVLPDGRYATCALGAAYEALTGQLPPSVYDGNRYLIDNAIVDATGATARIRQQVARWNDEEALTREEIAARLEAQGL